MKRPWLTLIRDRRGVSAVEFALLAPLMIAFYFGLAEFCQGFMAQKRVAHVASMVADLVSQSDEIDAAEMNDIFLAGQIVMRPFPAQPLRQRVSSVRMRSNGRVEVVWSRGSGMAARGVGSVVTVPDGLLNDGESLIMAEASYAYDSPVGFAMPGLTQFEQVHYLRPRRVDHINFR